MALTPEQEALVITLISRTQKTISQLEAETGLVGDKILPVENSEGTFACTVDDLKDYVEENLDGATTVLKGKSLLPSQITIANNVTDANNDIDFSAGVFNFSDGSGQAVASALTKRLDASWVAGTNQGGLDTGAEANSTWYHCYAIYNPTTLVSDFLFSTGATIPTSLPSGYTKYKWVGAFYNNSSGNISPFKQDGKTITFSTVTVYNNTSIPTATFENVTTITPLGIRVKALLAGVVDGGSGVNGMIVKDKVTGFQVQVIYTTLDDGGSVFSQFTDTNSSLQVAKSTSATLDDFIMYNYGWEIPDNLY